ncbi:hypothetical protein [Shewanella aestuarii]|uniref:Uncharacterized protein n=1 Tax=Shewanella aestuarii TaxID=1028752 RepID=A0A6G9QLX9_9GAMM|nr:hypothetical protein [Shewanella aestuarii]QIR15594.1 hypothetical protein HBH39_14785 [Shewanella aestuarii]
MGDLSLSVLFRVVNLPLKIRHHFSFFRRILPKKRASVQTVIDKIEHISHHLDDSAEHTAVANKTKVEQPHHH